jgi:hypothetical protein
VYVRTPKIVSFRKTLPGEKPSYAIEDRSDGPEYAPQSQFMITVNVERSKQGQGFSADNLILSSVSDSHLGHCRASDTMAFNVEVGWIPA